MGEQIDMMQERAVDFVEKIGLHVPHRGILDLLSNYQGVSIDGENVKFKSELVLKAIREAKFPVPGYAKDNWLISAELNATS